MKLIKDNFSKGDIITLEIKRFYCPGYYLEHKCECGNEICYDLGYEYISYPSLNHYNDFSIYCKKCDKENIVKIKITIDLELKNES